MQWDYGLMQDMELLCRYRLGPLPSLVPEDLWDDLKERWDEQPILERNLPMSAKRQRSEL